ncbi:hypothetical protein M0804_010735 [Polistes exclamans]|nr:hypothetical protein M0804_010735 [Polistes exclamans]
MVDYFSTSNSRICDKKDERNDFKSSMSTSVIMNQLLKKQDQILSPEDIASDALTSLSSETEGCWNNQRYIKTPIHWLSTHQTYTTIASSSSEISPNLQQKSIVHRYVSPQPPSFRQGIIDTNTFRSIRKTRSMIFPKSVTFS